MHDYLLALIGGGLLGLAVVGYLYVHGRIAGISGLLAQVLNPQTLFKTPALWFVLGIFIVPFFYGIVAQPKVELNESPLMMIVAGLLVGFGTRLGSGCTSGHGICGIGRFSVRSLIATGLFMFSGMLVVAFVH